LTTDTRATAPERLTTRARRPAQSRAAQDKQAKWTRIAPTVPRMLQNPGDFLFAKCKQNHSFLKHYAARAGKQVPDSGRGHLFHRIPQPASEHGWRGAQNRGCATCRMDTSCRNPCKKNGFILSHRFACGFLARQPQKVPKNM
jgi:hypothetical protein